MPRRRIPEYVRWQIIGMHGARLSCRNIGVNLDINHTVIGRFVRKHADTGHVSIVQDKADNARPLPEMTETLRLARRTPMTKALFLRLHWGTGVRVSDSTIRRRLLAAGPKARRPIRRPFLTDRHKQASLV